MKKLFIFLLILIFALAQNTETGFLRSYNDDWVETTLKQMTLREKIAQMVITRAEGFYIDENSAEFLRLRNLIEDHKIGGLIFFAGNSFQQAQLTNILQSISGVPLLISQDCERGTGMRLNDGSVFPSNMAIGATRNPELAYKMGLIIARECRTIGVHQNYAPVMDVNNNPLNPIINVRSFSEDPLLVSEMGVAMIKGLQEGGVIATAKHFPGHGDTDIDSHSDLPVLNFDMERLNRIELIPFKSAIDSGVKSVMIAHLSLPVLENTPFLPSSLSPVIVDRLLNTELNFCGLTITDALNMAGVTKHFSTDEIAVMCVKAGIDLILIPPDEIKTINAIENAVSKGIIDESRINLSARKILSAKKWLGLNQNKIVDISKVEKIINSSESRELSQQIADESITLVKNENIIPLPVNEVDTRCVLISLNSGNEKANSGYFIEKFKKKAYKTFGDFDAYEVNGEVKNANKILEYTSFCGYVIIPVYAKIKIKTGTVGLPISQLDLINTIISSGKKVVIISFGNPYIIQGFKNTPVYICAYSDSESSINSVVNALFGELNFKGKLPVTITENYKFGYGLTN